MSVKFNEEVREKYLGSWSEDYFRTFENFFDDYSNVFYVNLKKNTMHPVLNSVNYSPELRATFKEGYSKYREFFIKNFLLASDRAWFEERTSPKYIKEQLASAPHFAFVFNYVYHGEVRREFMKVSRFSDDPNKVIISGHSINPAIRYEAEYMRNFVVEKKQAVMNALSSDYELVLYMEDEFQTVTLYHASDRFARLFTDNGESHTGLGLFEVIKGNVVPEELDSFIERANRKTFWEHLSKDSTYEVKFNMMLDNQKTPCVLRYIKDANNDEGVIISLQSLGER